MCVNNSVGCGLQLALCGGRVCGGSQWCVSVRYVCVYVCMRTGGHVVHIALCSGVDVKYITVSNLHQLQCIYIHAGNELTKCPFCYFNMSCRVPVYMDPTPIQQTTYQLYDAMPATEASQESGREVTNRDATM